VIDRETDSTNTLKTY